MRCYCCMNSMLRSIYVLIRRCWVVRIIRRCKNLKREKVLMLRRKKEVRGKKLSTLVVWSLNLKLAFTITSYYSLISTVCIHQLSKSTNYASPLSAEDQLRTLMDQILRVNLRTKKIMKWKMLSCLIRRNRLKMLCFQMCWEVWFKRERRLRSSWRKKKILLSNSN